MKYLIKYLFLIISANLLAMNNNTDSSITSLSVNRIAQIQQQKAVDQASANIICYLQKHPEQINTPKAINALLDTSTYLLQAVFVRNMLPTFTPIFLSKCTDEQFIKVITQKDLIQKPEFQERFFALPQDKIEKFILDSKNKYLIDIIKRTIPEKALDSLSSRPKLQQIFSSQIASRKSHIRSIKNFCLILTDLPINITSRIIEFFYGSKNVSYETESFIRNLSLEMSITNYFTIKRIHPNIIKKTSNIKALIVFNHLFINEKYFKSLSEKEKYSFIYNELENIKKKNKFNKANLDLIHTPKTYIAYDFINMYYMWLNNSNPQRNIITSNQHISNSLIKNLLSIDKLSDNDLIEIIIYFKINKKGRLRIYILYTYKNQRYLSKIVL